MSCSSKNRQIETGSFSLITFIILKEKERKNERVRLHLLVTTLRSAPGQGKEPGPPSEFPIRIAGTNVFGPSQVHQQELDQKHNRSLHYARRWPRWDVRVASASLTHYWTTPASPWCSFLMSHRHRLSLLALSRLAETSRWGCGLEMHATI